MGKIRIENPNVLDKRRLEAGYIFLVGYKGETDILYEWEGILDMSKIRHRITIYMKKDTIRMYDPNTHSGYDAIRLIFWDDKNLKKQAVIRNLRIEEVRDTNRLLQEIRSGLIETTNLP